MQMGNLVFMRHLQFGMRDLEKDMKEAKNRFPQLQILFVVIHKKGDPAYGIKIDIPKEII